MTAEFGCECRRYHDIDCVADILGIPVKAVKDGCRAEGWPHLRIHRQRWLFTDALVDEIAGRFLVRNETDDAETRRGRKKAAPVVPGQTARSRARAS